MKTILSRLGDAQNACSLIASSELNTLFSNKKEDSVKHMLYCILA